MTVSRRTLIAGAIVVLAVIGAGAAYLLWPDRTPPTVAGPSTPSTDPGAVATGGTPAVTGESASGGGSQVAAATPSEPQPLREPVDNPILTVSGNISNTNAVTADGASVARFDLPMLEELGLTTINTTTNWTEGVVSFEGVLFSDLLDAVGASGTTVHAVAINDYAVDLEIAELRQYPVLLAFRRDGELMRVRDKGPIWVVYPRDDYPELMDEANNIKWIWQLDRIAVVDGQTGTAGQP